MKNVTFGFYNHDLARNAPYLVVNGVAFYFSYSTLVAVSDSSGCFVLKTPFGTITEEQLYWIDMGQHKRRLDQEDFDKHVKRAMKEAGIKGLPTIAMTMPK